MSECFPYDDSPSVWVRRSEYDARLAEHEAEVAAMRAALTLLTNGMKYSTEVVTIARDALGAAK